jgi:predicted Rossmann fold nucleotide-binding protein DprA/Smf involved in DNA uptake
MLLQKGVNLAYRPSDVLSKLELLYPDKIRIPAYAYRVEEIKIKPKAERREAFIGEETKKPKLNKEIGKLEPSEQAIVDALVKSKALIPDEIVASTGLDAGDVMSSLTVLELYGVVSEDASGKYSLV